VETKILTLKFGLRYDSPQSHRSKRENLQPPQHFRLCHGHWGPLVRQPGTEGLCAENWAWLDPFKNGKTRCDLGLGSSTTSFCPSIMYFRAASIHHLRRARANKPPFPNAVQGFNANAPVCGVPRAHGGCPAGISRPISNGELPPATLLYHAGQLKPCSASAW